MNAHQSPLSPVSIASSEWSGVGRYQSTDRNYSPVLGSNNGRSNLITPPVSGYSHGVNGNSQSGMNGKPSDYRNNPSPPSSVARSSNGTTMSLETQRRKQSMMEDHLAQHYLELKGFLAKTLREDRNNGKTNRARDKLLRLTTVQFQELSTDVYDELLRRKAFEGLSSTEREKRPGFLLPKENFHPKRNQARQKLSTLPIARFTALATDVFFELERRFPRFAVGNMSRSDSPANSIRGPPSRTGTPEGMRPSSKGQGQGPRRPGYPRQGSLGGQVFPGHGIPAMGSHDDYNRPAPKSSQTNTIVPNKSYLVEEDDDNEYVDDMYSITRRDTSNTTRSASSMERDKKMIADYQNQVSDLQGKVTDLQDRVRGKDGQVAALENEKQELESAGREYEEASNEWSQVQKDLENKLEEALKLNDNLQSEIDKVRASHANAENTLRSQLEHATTQGKGNNEWRARYDDTRQKNEELQKELQEQHKITNEVRQETSSFLKEMQAISDRSGQNWEREEKLGQQVERLEAEVKEWKTRYARVKTQLRTVRAGSIGISIQQPNAAQHAKDGGLSRPDGLVRDFHVTKFQIAIDDVLRIARVGEPQTVIEYMKFVVVAVRNICQDITDSPPVNEELTQQRARLRSNVSATANNFITASKNFAQSHGISPISLLDAAASHLSASVVDLARTVKVRPTPAGELGDDEGGNLPLDSVEYVNTTSGMNGRDSLADSVYSSNTPAQQLSPPPQTRKRAPSAAKQLREYTAGRRSPSKNGLPNGNATDLLPRTAYTTVTRDNEVEDLKLFLEDQTEGLVQSIQSLVSSIRVVDEPGVVHDRVDAMAAIVGHVVKETQRVIDKTGNLYLRDQAGSAVRTLAGCKARLLAADDDSRASENHSEWKEHINTLPPIAFEIAREMKELVQRVDRVADAARGGMDEFRI
ncbi:component of the polarisome [Lambiella insularis]|nr:component of the polarisome [Lambiella insularis]